MERQPEVISRQEGNLGMLFKVSAQTHVSKGQNCLRPGVLENVCFAQLKVDLTAVVIELKGLFQVLVCTSTVSSHQADAGHHLMG